MSPDQLRVAALFGACKDIFEKYPHDTLPDSLPDDELREFARRSWQFFWTAEEVDVLSVPPLASQLLAEHLEQHMEGTL